MIPDSWEISYALTLWQFMSLEKEIEYSIISKKCIIFLFLILYIKDLN